MSDPYSRFTETAKKSLEIALREALSLGHNYIGTEHILLALVRQDTLASQALGGLGATPDAVRNEVIRLLSRPAQKKEASLSELLRRAADRLEERGE